MFGHRDCPHEKIISLNAFDMIPAVRYGIPQTLGGVWAVSRPTHSVAGSLFGKVIAGSSRFLHKKKPLVKVTFPEGFEIADGTHVDLGDTVELKNGDFMRVRKYEKHTKGSAYRKHVVSGWLFRRVNKTVGLSREYHNEVYQVDYLGGLSTHLSPEDRGIQDTSLSKVLRKRDLMLVTSPDRVSEKGGRGKSETAKCLDILFCQWRQQFRTKRAIKDKPGDAFNLKEGSPAEAAYLPLRPGGCEQRRINDIDKENLSREKQESEVSRGNCKDPVSPRSSECEPLFSAPEGFESLSLEDENKDGRLKSTSSDSPMPEYTFLDFFFGAGGASCGARAAGLKVLGGFDHDANPCETYRLNFPYADGRQMDAQDHGSIRNGEWKADIVHFSPPCQAFSKANTSPNAQKDKTNVAANNLVGVWLDKIVPRIATVEQTDGLLVRRRHRKHLDSMIQSFTSRGFSIRLDLLNLADFGVPQPRKRLIILAAR